MSLHTGASAVKFSCRASRRRFFKAASYTLHKITASIVELRIKDKSFNCSAELIAAALAGETVHLAREQTLSCVGEE
ncbi:hypothetical protein AAU61_17355 [Desulfocarbo indianensis]|nr:hypothetical protein AAU61_17355 [Desulfocarbo indianensis]